MSVVYGDLFSKGKTDIGLYLGASSSMNYTYTVVGVSGNYFIADNLSIGGMYRNWFGSGPTQNEISLFTNYYVPLDRKFRPYIGIFGRKTYVSSDKIDDFASYGARAGMSMTTSKNSYFSLGYAIEYYDNCVATGLFSSECSRSYPELIFGLSF
jgi:hypothetical protein